MYHSFISRIHFTAQSLRLNENELVWCTSNQEEQYKCQNFSAAVEADRELFGYYYIHLSCRLVTLFVCASPYTVTRIIVQIVFQQAANKDECMDLLDQELADITSMDGGELFIGGRYHSLVPILQEAYEGEPLERTNFAPRYTCLRISSV